MPHADSTAASRGTITRSRSSWRATSVTCSAGRAAEREDGKASRIDPAAHRNEPDAFGHVRVDDAMDALSRAHAIDTELVGDAIDGGLGGTCDRAARGRRESCRGRGSRGRDWRPSPSPRCRRGRSRRDPAARRRSRGPTCSTPLWSTRAIEPPPAPMLAMSRLCSATRWPAMRRSDAIAASPPTTSEMSVEVPPMSKGMRSPWSSSRAAYWLPATPPAGPESTPPAASRTASAMVATPPCDWMISTGARKSRLAQPRLQADQIALQRRPDVGIDDSRAERDRTP